MCVFQRTSFSSLAEMREIQWCMECSPPPGENQLLLYSQHINICIKLPICNVKFTFNVAYSFFSFWYMFFLWSVLSLKDRRCVSITWKRSVQFLMDRMLIKRDQTIAGWNMKAESPIHGQALLVTLLHFFILFFWPPFQSLTL